MVQKTTRPTDKIGLVATIDPDAQTAGASNSDWVAVADFDAFMATVMVGSMGASATVDAKIEQATDSSGTGAKDVDGKAITQLTQAGGDADKQAIIEFCGEDLDVDNDFTHARLVLTVGTATCDTGGTIHGLNARYGPASDRDLASVDEIIGLDA